MYPPQLAPFNPSTLNGPQRTDLFSGTAASGKQSELKGAFGQMTVHTAAMQIPISLGCDGLHIPASTIYQLFFLSES